MKSKKDQNPKQDVPPSIMEEHAFITLVQGQIDGKSYYAYARIPLSKYLAFKEAEEKGDYDLADFGEILEHGPGKNPPPEVKKRMIEKYKISENFEEEVIDAFKQILKDPKKKD
jgi:hypothetical protein